MSLACVKNPSPLSVGLPLTSPQYFGYLTNLTISGLIAQPNHGATVVIEHRFFGLSNPYPDLSTTSLALLTIEQAIDDLVYFAQNVNLPFPAAIEDGSQVGPDRNPWVSLVLFLSSYTAPIYPCPDSCRWKLQRRIDQLDVRPVWFQTKAENRLISDWEISHPGVFHAGYASSAVVQAINYYWAYFEPIRQYMPRNCTADVERVIEYMDQTFIEGKQVQELAPVP